MYRQPGSNRPEGGMCAAWRFLRDAASLPSFASSAAGALTGGALGVPRHVKVPAADLWRRIPDIALCWHASRNRTMGKALPWPVVSGRPAKAFLYHHDRNEKQIRHK